MRRRDFCSLIVSLLLSVSAMAQESYSGIYPHLAYFNGGGECGTGAVAPWADRLWVITYSPHSPKGSDDKLYEITPDLELIVRPESIGGTPANRMIHRESKQLFIGPYAIDAERNVRAIRYAEMLGRPTGNARHLTDPEKKIYYATMEEGFYEVDVDTLKVTELYADTHARRTPRADLRSSFLSTTTFTLPPGGSRGTSGEGDLRDDCDFTNPSPAATASDPPEGRVKWAITRRKQLR